MEGVTGPDAQAPDQTPTAPEQTPAEPNQRPGFAERGRMRRRTRFLRKARELALRDLGGLVFEMHRFGQQTSDALLAKLSTLGQVDAELRALEAALGRGHGVTVLHEVGIAACPRCAAIHGRDDRFCPGCGLAFDSHAERPIATSPVSIPGPGARPHASAAPTAAPAPAPSSTHPASTDTPPTSGSPTSPPTTTPPTPPPTPIPPIKPTAPPVAARPGAPSPSPSLGPTPPAPQAPAPDKPAHGASSAGDGSDQPTEVLRPPVGGG